MRALKENLEGPGQQSGKFDDLLAGPLGQSLDVHHPKIKRKTASYISKDDQFLIKTREYDRQFSQLYFYRLVTMRPLLEASAKAAWPNSPIVRVLDVPEDGETVVIGTLYKEMDLKPSILDEYTKDRGLSAHLGKTKFTQPSDALILEDESARIALTGDAITPGDCVTGVIVAVRGMVLDDGRFNANAFVFADMPPQPTKKALFAPDTTEEDKYVALVSGLSLGNSTANPMHLQLLVEYCCGALGNVREQAIASKICRVVVAGGILQGTSQLSQPTLYGTVREQTTALESIHEADVRLTELSSCLPVDIMPGAADPANYSLPQQPLHPCLFPGASTFSSFSRCTNPHSFVVDDVHFLGTSGQNVDDIARYSDMDNRAEILGSLLKWRHLIPTAPDTLASYPYFDADPFIMNEAPHVLFAGCQPEFSTSLVKGTDGQVVRIVAVPEFASSGMMVLVNLRTLGVHPVHFDVGSPMMDSQLLSRKTPLGICWLASHLESKRLKRAQVFEVSIAQSCDSIINPEAPLALRLSGQLLLGVVRIYQRKLTFLETDAKNAIDGLQRKEGTSQNVDLPDGGTAPEITITLPDNDMGLFGGSDLFPSFNIGDGSPLDVMTTNHGGLAGRLSLGGGTESLTLADDISDVFGSTRWTASEERFDIVGADDIDRRFSAELERLRSQAAIENPRDAGAADAFYDGGGDDSYDGPMDDTMEPPPLEMFDHAGDAVLPHKATPDGVPLPGMADIRITPPSLGFNDIALPEIGTGGTATTIADNGAGEGGATLPLHQRRKKKVVMDVGYDGMAATQLSNDEIRKLLNDRAPLLKKRGPLFARRQEGQQDHMGIDASLQAAKRESMMSGPMSTFDVRVQSQAARDNYMYRLACYDKLAPELLAVFNRALGLAPDGRFPTQPRHRSAMDAHNNAQHQQQDGERGEEEGGGQQGPSPAPSWAFDDVMNGGDGGDAGGAAFEFGYDDFGGQDDYDDDIDATQNGMPGYGFAHDGGGEDDDPAMAALNVVPVSVGDRGGSDEAAYSKDGFTARTRVVLGHLQSKFSNTPAPGSKRRHPQSSSPAEEAKEVSLGRLVAGKTRLEACRWFFESLVLRNKGFVDLEQSEPYGDILIKPLSKLNVQEQT